MEVIYQQINLMEPVAVKIKNIFYNNIDWEDCYKDVAKKLSDLKKKAKEFYVDKSEHDIAMELSKYKQSDIQDMMCLTKLS